MTAEAALVGALREAAGTLTDLAARLESVRLEHVEAPRLLILSGPLLGAVADLEKEAVRLVTFAPYANTATQLPDGGA